METLQERLEAVDLLLKNRYVSPAVILMRPIAEHMLKVILIDKGLWDEAGKSAKKEKRNIPGLWDIYKTLENKKRHEVTAVFGNKSDFFNAIRKIANDAVHNNDGVELSTATGCRDFFDALIPDFLAKYPDERHLRSFTLFSKPLIDVTHSFANKTVTLKARINNRYVSVRKDSPRGDLFCFQAEAQAWEEFQTAESWDGNIAFRGVNGKWLSARVDANPAILLAEAQELSGWERFRVYKSGNDFYIMSAQNSKWLLVRPENADPVEAAGDDIADKGDNHNAFLIDKR